MKPKEKAEELVNKYRDVRWDIDPNTAKQCALIAVDEILEQCNDYRDIDLGKSYDYWQEVKEEIEKL